MSLLVSCAYGKLDAYSRMEFTLQNSTVLMDCSSLTLQLSTESENVAIPTQNAQVADRMMKSLIPVSIRL